MVYDQPNLEELKRMIDFCKENQHLFIYGCEEKQQRLKKYLSMCDIGIDGFIITNRVHWEFEIDETPIYTLEEIKFSGYKKEEVAILLALPAMYYNDVLCELQSIGYKKVFYMSEYNKRTIAYKMRPRVKEQFWVEVSLVDHCNLNCQMCDHFAPLAKTTFLDINTFQRDMVRLAKLTRNKIGSIKLQGGEPLLHSKLLKFIKIARKNFPDSIISLFTDGLLLKQWENNKYGNLWEACFEYKVQIELTIYPIGININEIEKLAEKYNVCVKYFTEAADRDYRGIKHSVKHPFRLEGNVEKWQFISCYQFNESITLKDGKLYTCPMIPCIEHFNTYFNQDLKVEKNDYLDIQQAQNYQELAEFVTHRTNFCKYCDICNRRTFEWKQSKHTLDEYVDI